MDYKIVNNIVAVPSTQLKSNTRVIRGNGKKFHQIYAGTNYYKFSFFPMLVLLWNALLSNVLGSWPRGIQRCSHQNPRQIHLSIYPN